MGREIEFVYSVSTMSGTEASPQRVTPRLGRSSYQCALEQQFSLPSRVDPAGFCLEGRGTAQSNVIHLKNLNKDVVSIWSTSFYIKTLI